MLGFLGVTLKASKSEVERELSPDGFGRSINLERLRRSFALLSASSASTSSDQDDLPTPLPALGDPLSFSME